MLDNLQTQRTIDEKISALHSTVGAFNVIFTANKTKNYRTNLNIQGLSKQIADLRVQILDITQKR